MTTMKPEFLASTLLDEIRGRFWYADACPYEGPRTFLEASAGSLRLKSVVEVMAQESALPDQHGRANPGAWHADEVLSKGIEDVRLFLGARQGTIMPALSSTHAVFAVVNAVLSSVAGSNVVTTNLDHPSVYDSTRFFAERYGKEWRVAQLSPETGSVQVDAILDKIDSDTCLLGVIHASNITGAVLDIKTIVREARKINPDLWVLADGVQYAPHGPLDVEDLGVDAYVFGPYKVFCVKGIGFAYLSDRSAGLPHWKLAGKRPTDWTLGSPEHATYAAWSAVVDYLAWLGGHFTDSADRRLRVLAAMNRTSSHVGALLHRVLHGSDQTPGLLGMRHITLHGMADDIRDRVCVVAFNLEGMEAEQGVQEYRARRIRVHNRISDAYSRHTLEALGVSQVIRLSACHYTTPEEIELFLEATASIA